MKAVVAAFNQEEGPSWGHLRDYEPSEGPPSPALAAVFRAGESLGRKECPMSGVCTDRCQGAG